MTVGSRGDGGELQLFHPAPRHKEPKGLGPIAPLGGRVVLFWSDYRVPHEVLQTWAPRYTVTLWYYDHDERARALESDHALGAADGDGESDVGGRNRDGTEAASNAAAAAARRQRLADEEERVRQEIASFELELGGKAAAKSAVSEFEGHGPGRAESSAPAQETVTAQTTTAATAGAGVSPLEAAAEVPIAGNGTGMTVGSSVLVLMPDGSRQHATLTEGEEDDAFVCVQFENGTTEFVDRDDLVLPDLLT